jgi:glutamyl-tRNA synthetase
MTETIRVRIAPSPTGDPHVGLAYITLFNYAFAKKNGGKMILRIEDTDQARSKPSSERMIMDSLRWLGFQWDEGPDVGGPHGPYRQSERQHIYRKYADQLIENHRAYYCFCTSERLEKLREEQQKKKDGSRTGYDGKCRELDREEVQRMLDSRKDCVIRLITPLTGKTTFVDELRGPLEFDNERVDDQVLIKSDGFPTYHLANVVDDHLMGITHVIRAEEWISSTPKHVMLYEAFGWKAPQFIHMPLLRNADRSKISKRKNPISLNFYREKGVLPQALINFLSLMSWSFSGDQEIFTLQEMIDKFHLKDISLGGPVFDLQKLKWINQQYILQMDQERFVGHLMQEVFSQQYLAQIFPLMRERVETFDEFVEKSLYFFSDPKPLSLQDLCPKTREVDALQHMLTELLERLDNQYVWEMVHLQALIDEHQQAIGWKPKEYLPTLRMIVTGRHDSPPISKTLEVLGRERVRQRIRSVLP